MKTVRLTMAQALVRYLAAQKTVLDGSETRLVAGMWAIFGHGNVAALGEALWQARGEFPTFRGHNEQAMALAAIGFAKASMRRRFMACASSIGPGATNLVTAAAAAHVNRLPVLLLPADVFADRRPDPVLQQVEDFADGTVSANDCLRPVSRYFDRITRPEQLVTALPRALAVLTDPSDCGPVTLALCQDVQAQAFDYAESFFAPRTWSVRRIRPDEAELAVAAATVREASKPLVVAGGGVLYSEGGDALRMFAERHGVPVSETQSGKSSLACDHDLNVGAIGVSGSSAANTLASEADLILAVGTRLSDIVTGSRALFRNPALRIVGLNVQSFDAGKHLAVPLVADARTGLNGLAAALGDWRSDTAWTARATALKTDWEAAVEAATADSNTDRPSDAQVIGAVQRASGPDDIVVAAAGGLPGELHKLWRAAVPGGYHLEYGYSCMGYEIAGGLGVKMALPDRTVIVLIGDGSYLMMNSEIATSVALRKPLLIVVLDNRGFGCIDRLQRATGGGRFNNMFETTFGEDAVAVDFAAHAASLGAVAKKVGGLTELEAAAAEARGAAATTVLVIETDPAAATEAGGHWWDVAVPEVSTRGEVRTARAAYDAARAGRAAG